MRDSWRRIFALARKDAEEVRHQPGLIWPSAALVAGMILPGLAVMVAMPALTGESLADTEFAEAAAAAATARTPELAALSPAAQAQAFLLQQFLLFGLLVPILGALSLAAQAVIGEKQARALEPLLTTPLTTMELLTAKVLTPFVLSIALLTLTFGLYLVGLAGWGEPGVWRTLLWPRTLLLYVVIGPLVSWTALMGAAIISSRVNDPRTAQQLGGFVVLPVTAMFVAQFVGQFLVDTTALTIVAGALLLTNVALTWLGARVFRRDTILTRWK